MPQRTNNTAKQVLARAARFVTAAQLALVGGCLGGGDGGAASYSDPIDGADHDGSGVTPSGNGPAMVTLFGADTVRAGEVAQVNCFVREGTSLFLPQTAVLVTVSPAAGDIVVSGGSATFTPTAAGSYRAYCRTADSTLIDLVGATMTVEAGPAVSWTVDLLDRDCYSQTLGLPLDYEVYDAYGNLADNATVDLRSVPSTEITRDGRGRFVLAGEGTFDITLELTSPVAPGSDIRPFVATVLLDSTPPSITLTSPARGAMLQAGGFDDDTVTLTGEVTDGGTPIVSLDIAGVVQTVDGRQMSATFEVAQTSRWGVNLVDGHAEDACGNVGALGQAYLRGPEYYDGALHPTATGRVGAATLTQLNQSVIDDGDRASLDDMASIVNAVFAGLDFNALVYPGKVLVYDLLTDPCANLDCFLTFSSGLDTGFTVWRSPYVADHVIWNAPVIDSVRIVDGGVQLAAHMGQFAFPMRVWAAEKECAWGCSYEMHDITLDAWMGFNRLDFGGTFGVTLVGGQPQVTFKDINFNIDGAYLNPDCGALDGVCDAAANFATDYAIGAVEGLVRDALTNQVPPILAQALGGLTVAACVQPPAPLDIQLNIATTLDTIAFCGPAGGLSHPAVCPTTSPASGFGWMGLGLQFFPSRRGDSIPESARGSLRKGGTLANFTGEVYDFGVGVQDDALNQLMWGLWYGGAFDLDLSDMLADVAPAGTELSIATALPPVVMPGRDGYEVQVGMGDVLVSATLDLASVLGDLVSDPVPFHVTAYFSLVMGGSIDIDSARSELVLQIDPNAEAVVQIVEIDDVAAGYTGEVSELVARLMREKLPELLQGAIGTMPLPALEVGGLPGLPNDIYWGIGNASIARTDSYMAMTGMLTTRQADGPIDSPELVWQYACR
ncbi:MAG: hypothetical protein AAB426_05950 [Myxococcota bacterium]